MSKAMIAAFKTAEVEDGVIRLSNQFRDMIVSELETLELLKGQETEWEHLWDAPDGTFKGRCKKCGFVHFFIEGHDGQYKFCPECGRAVKWDA